MAKTQVLLDTNLLYRTGQLQVLLDLERRGVIELNISSETAYKEYKQNYKSAWQSRNKAMLNQMKEIGAPIEQEQRKMDEDFAKESRVISRIKVLDISVEEANAFKTGIKDKSDAFLLATAKKHGLKNIISGDNKAVDKEELAKAGYNFTDPDTFLYKFTYVNQEAMARVFHKEIRDGRTFPPALEKFDGIVRTSIQNLRDGMVFVIDHGRVGKPVEAYWRAAPVRAA